MKIAFLIAGQARKWEHAFSYFKSLQQVNQQSGLDVDFFLSIWDKEGTKRKDYSGSKSITVREGFFKKVSVDPIITSFPSSSFYMANRWKRAIELRQEYEKENNISYDLVILTRPDIIILNYDQLIERCLFLNSEKGIQWNNPLTILTDVGCIIHYTDYNNEPTGKEFPGNRLYYHYSDDKALIGNPLAIDTFKNLYEDLLSQRLPSSQHKVIVEHCFKHRLLNTTISTDFNKWIGLKLNREVDYPKKSWIQLI